MAVNLDASPAYILIRGHGLYPPELNGTGKGYIANVADTDHRIGPNGLNADQQPPNWIQAVISDVTVRQCLHYLQQWETIIDYETLPGGNLAQDYHIIRAFVDPSEVSQSNQNSLTRGQVENFINRWGGIVLNAAQNSVTFEAYIYNTLVSEGFWDRNVSAIQFSETFYNQGTGEHRILVDITGLSMNINKIAGYLINHGCTIIGDVTQNQLTFSCLRNQVVERFKADIKQRAWRIYGKRKWYVRGNAVDAIIAAGGIMDVTAAQALNNMYSRIEND